MAEKSIRVKLQPKEDRISVLPGCLIQYILSLLPSTAEAVRTTLLSKRWHNLWTRVPILIFDSTGMSPEKFNRLVGYTLLMYNCSKIQKFHIQTNCDQGLKDLNWHVKIRFAIRKDVEDLSLKMWLGPNMFSLSEFVFNHQSLVKLQIYNCDFDLICRVSWGNLKVLNMQSCKFPRGAIENILSGSPSLESLELTSNFQFNCYFIVSKSLKKLVLQNLRCLILQISCPNLEEFKLCDVVSSFAQPKLMDWPSLICANLDFNFNGNVMNDLRLIPHFRHAKELKFGCRFIRSLSVSKLGADISYMLFNNKSLTLDSPNFENHSAGIESALRLSYVIQKLVIQLRTNKSPSWMANLPVKNVPNDQNYWDSKKTVINCLVSHLKIVEINSLSESDNEYEFVLKFVEFLLKNGRVLEKLVVIVKDGGKDFVIKVSQKLLNFTRCSEHAMVELLCSN